MAKHMRISGGGKLGWRCRREDGWVEVACANGGSNYVALFKQVFRVVNNATTVACGLLAYRPVYAAFTCRSLGVDFVWRR
jgi:hypothetical protein